MFSKLFSPVKIRGMELKNRVMLPAMGTKFSGKTSYVTPKLIHYHTARIYAISINSVYRVACYWARSEQ